MKKGKGISQYAGKIVKILLLIALLIASYGVGWVAGAIDGIYAIQSRNNDTLCSLFNKTYDDRGYCILSTNHKYTRDLTCWFGNFTIKGNATLPTYLEPLLIPQKLVYYPILRCW